MAALIPDATLGATYTNEITGVTYTYDGMKWVIEGVTENDHEHELPEHEHELPEHKHEEFVKLSGDYMTGQLSITPSKNTTTPLAVYAGEGLDDTNTQTVGAFINSTGRAILEIRNDGAVKVGDMFLYHEPSTDNELVAKKYVDRNQSIFKFRTPEGNITNNIKDGEVWCNPNNASTWWISYKTYHGRNWSIPAWSGPLDNENYPDGNNGTSKVLYWTRDGVTQPFMTVYDIERNIPIACLAVKKMNFIAYLEADGVTERDKGNYQTFRVNIDIDTSTSGNVFARPRENSLVRISLPSFL